jgi:hypothetical protein
MPSSKKLKPSPTIPRDSPLSNPSPPSQKKSVQTPGSENSSPAAIAIPSPKFQNFASSINIAPKMVAQRSNSVNNSSMNAANQSIKSPPQIVAGNTSFISPSIQGNAAMKNSQFSQQQPFQVNQQFANIQQQQQQQILLQQQQQQLIQQQQQLQQQKQQQQNNQFNQAQNAQFRAQNMPNARVNSPMVNANTPNALGQSQPMMGRNLQTMPSNPIQQQSMSVSDMQQHQQNQDKMQQNFQSYLQQPNINFQAFNNSQQILQNQKQQFEQHLERNNMALAGNGMQGNMAQNMGMQQQNQVLPLGYNNAMMQQQNPAFNQNIIPNTNIWSGNLTWTTNINTAQQMEMNCAVTAHSVRQAGVNDM